MSSTKSFVTAKFLSSLISGRSGAGLAGWQKRLKNNSLRKSLHPKFGMPRAWLTIWTDRLPRRYVGGATLSEIHADLILSGDRDLLTQYLAAD